VACFQIAMAVRDVRFFQIPSLLTHTYVPLSEGVDKHGGMLICWKELNEDGSALLGREKMAVLSRHYKIFLPFIRFLFDNEIRNKMFEHTGIQPLYYKFIYTIWTALETKKMLKHALWCRYMLYLGAVNIPLIRDTLTTGCRK
jgi:hypothetical protein